MKVRGEAIVAGGGGHASVVIDLLRANGVKVKGLIGPTPTSLVDSDCPYLGSDDLLSELDRMAVHLAVGIGTLKLQVRRKAFFRRVMSMGFSLPSIVHPVATLAASSELHDGVQVMAGSIVNPFATIGENTILNTRCVIEHHVCIGSHSHVAPGAVICGETIIGDEVFVGAGATVIQGVRVGDGAFVAAGAVVTEDVAPGSMVKGIPAR